MYYVLGIVGIFVLITGSVAAVAAWHTGSLKLGWSLARSREFVVWVMVTSQTIVQVTKRSVNAPPTVQAVYAALGVLELDTVAVLHPDCYAGNPFTVPLVELCGSLVLIVGLVVTGQLMRWPLEDAPKLILRLNALAPRVFQALLSCLILLYSLVCNTSLSMIHCHRDAGGSSSGGGLVLAQNPRFKCYEGEHTAVGVLGWLALITHVVGFPVFTLLYIYRRLKMWSFMSKAWETAWKPFVAHDFKEPRYFMLVHLNFAVVLLLSALLVLVPSRPSTPIGTEVGVFIVTVVAAVGPLALMMALQPYVELRSWRKIIKYAALIVTAFLAVANLVCALYAHALTPRGVAEGVSFAVLAVLVAGGLVFLWHFGAFVWRMKGTTRYVQSVKAKAKARKRWSISVGINRFVTNPLRTPVPALAADSKRDARCVAYRLPIMSYGGCLTVLPVMISSRKLFLRGVSDSAVM